LYEDVFYFFLKTEAFFIVEIENILKLRLSGYGVQASLKIFYIFHEDGRTFSGRRKHFS
jgi:hypothetical protein